MSFGSLDNGFRSKCHYAPIKIGFKTIKGTKTKIKVWVCTKCSKRDIDIISYAEYKSQVITDDVDKIFPIIEE